MFSSCSVQEKNNAVDSFPVLTGDYLGQSLPGNDPEVFAPGIISTGIYTRDIAMTPDKKEIYFCLVLPNYSFSTILFTKQVDGTWTEPEVVPHMEDPDILNLEPFISPDGQKFFFLSTRPDTTKGETTGDQDIWIMNRNGESWDKPYNPGEPVNSEQAEFFPSVTNDGTIYFSRAEPNSSLHYIYRSRFINGKYITPERLPDQVNSGANQYNAFIAPDESYIIVPTTGRKDSYGGCDYYIVFRNEKDNWSEPVNMGEKINTMGSQEYSPYVSPDGKYFFFMSTRLLSEEKAPVSLTYNIIKKINSNPQNGNPCIYWISTSIIEELKPVTFE